MNDIPEETHVIILGHCDEPVMVLRLVCKQWERLTWDRYLNSAYDITRNEYRSNSHITDNEDVIERYKYERMACQILYDRSMTMPDVPISMSDIASIRLDRFVRQLMNYDRHEASSGAFDPTDSPLALAYPEGEIDCLERLAGDDENWRCTVL